MADAHLRYVGRSKLHFYGASSPSVSNFSIQGTTYGTAFITQSQANSAIEKIGFRLGTRTGTSAISYVVGIESVSTSTGFPSGTYVQNGGVDCKATYNAPTSGASDGTWQEVTLATTYAPSFGELLAFTIRTSDGTVSGTQNISVSTNCDSQVGWSSTNTPYAARLTSGTWSTTYSGSAAAMIGGYATASNYYGMPWQGLYTGATAATIGRRIGAVFNLPSTMFPSFKIRGFTWVGNIATAGGKAPIAGLWNSGGVLQNVTLDSDQGRAPATSLRHSTFTFDESSLSTLSGGTDYYIGLEVADAASSAITLNGAQYASSTVADADSGGALLGAATYDGSNWTTDYSVRPWIELILDDHTATTSTTGGIVIGG